MGVLRQEFLNQTIFNLKKLLQEASSHPLSEDFLRHFFRQLHTIKGTAKTFNLNHLARLAHEIENLLQAVQNKTIEQNDETKVLFANSFKQLLEMCKDYQANAEVTFPQEFTNTIRKLLPDSVADYSTDSISAQIPNHFWSQLAPQEKINLSNALQNGKNFYPMQVTFALTTFYENFKRLKEVLNENGEVIAVAPSETEKPLEQIAFQIFFVSLLPQNKIEESAKSFVVKIEFLIKDYAEDLSGVLSRLIENCQITARQLNKQISFEQSKDNFEVTPQNLILINKIASHLLNNAIDHGVESVEERTKNGKNPVACIKINVSILEIQILLEIKDEGRGIDFEKIITQAKKKNLIAQDRVLNEKEALELIFSQGFTTNQTVSQISGRGVGLDAVKDLVEKSGGKIEVSTKLGKGTTFSIFLPQN